MGYQYQILRKTRDWRQVSEHSQKHMLQWLCSCLPHIRRKEKRITYNNRERNTEILQHAPITSKLLLIAHLSQAILILNLSRGLHLERTLVKRYSQEITKKPRIGKFTLQEAPNIYRDDEMKKKKQLKHLYYIHARQRYLSRRSPAKVSFCTSVMTSLVAEIRRTSKIGRGGEITDPATRSSESRESRSSAMHWLLPKRVRLRYSSFIESSPPRPRLDRSTSNLRNSTPFTATQRCLRSTLLLADTETATCTFSNTHNSFSPFGT